MEHELKILPQYFAAVKEGTKTFEIRKNDRGFKVGDILLLREWINYSDSAYYNKATPNRYTGQEITKEVTYILEGGQYGLEEGYCILGLRNIEKNIKDRIKALVRTDGFNIFDDEGFICGTLGVNKEKLKGLLHEVNDSICLKNIDLTGISKLEQARKVTEEQEEFIYAFSDYRENPTDENKNHAIEEWWDRNQAELGVLEKEGIKAEEVMKGYPKHLEKIKSRPRKKENTTENKVANTWIMDRFNKIN